METLNNEQTVVLSDGKDGLVNEANGQNNVRDAAGEINTFQEKTKTVVKGCAFIVGLSAACSLALYGALLLSDFASRKIEEAREKRKLKKALKRFAKDFCEDLEREEQ